MYFSIEYKRKKYQENNQLNQKKNLQVRKISNN